MGTELPESKIEYTSIDPNRFKIDGWLGLFCISQILISPLMNLDALTTAGQNFSKLYAIYPILQSFVLFVSVITIILSIFGIIVGILLLKKYGNAAELAKYYLISLLVGRLISFALPLCSGLPSTVINTMLGETSIDLVKSFIYVAIWYTYLKQSVKIKNIFGDSTEKIPSKLYYCLGALAIVIMFVFAIIGTRSNSTVIETSQNISTQTIKPITLVSNDGRFSINFPAGAPLPNRTEQTLNTASGPIQMYTYMAELPNGAFCVTYYDVPPSIFKTKNVDLFLKDCSTGVANYAKLQINIIQDFQFRGYPAKRSFLSGQIDGATVYGRSDLILSKMRLFQVFTIMKNKNEIDNGSGKAFSDSFALID